MKTDCKRRSMINDKMNERRFPTFLCENFAIENDTIEHNQNNGNRIK